MHRYFFLFNLVIEKCGDGKYLGILECDDGNLENGDGCSSECQIEPGFMCNGGSDISPDQCTNIILPKAYGEIFDLNKNILISFDKPIKFLPTSDFSLNDVIKIELDEALNFCKFEFTYQANLNHFLMSNNYFDLIETELSLFHNEIEIELNLFCSVQENQVIFRSPLML